MKKALILRPFNDAGTGKSFKAGETANLYDGVFANYQLAGLVELAEIAAPASPPANPASSKDASDQAADIPPADRAE